MEHLLVAVVAQVTVPLVDLAIQYLRHRLDARAVVA
jgi:hypothetical protein